MLGGIKIASDKGITVSTDLNYRAKLWKYGKPSEPIMTELTSYCDVIVGGEKMLKNTLVLNWGLDITTRDQVKAEAFQSVCEQMMKKFPKAKKVITTFRGSISASHNGWNLYDGINIYSSPEYQITHIVDRLEKETLLWVG